MSAEIKFEYFAWSIPEELMPINPKYRLLEDRIKTFETVNIEHSMELAKVGFYHYLDAGNNSRVICYHCGTTSCLFENEVTAKSYGHSLTCCFVLADFDKEAYLKEFKEFSERYNKLMVERGIRKIDSKGKIIEGEKVPLRDDWICRGCNQPVEIEINPCHHNGCIQCTKSEFTCPKCKRPYYDTQEKGRGS